MKPYEYYDRSSGSYKGLVIDYFDKISKITGLEFKFVMRGNEKDTKDKLENGEIQLLSSTADSSASSQMYPISLTDSYYLSATEIVYNRAVENPLDTSNCVILKNGYPQYQRLAEEQGYTDIVYCDSFEECIREVNSGKADISYLPGYAAVRMLDHAYLDKVKELSTPASEFECSIGVSDICDERLISILNKSLASMTISEENAIFTNAISNNKDATTIEDIFYGNLIMILCIIILIIAAIGVFALHNAHRRKQVNIQLTKAKDAAEIANKAKSEFLSRMSHDMRTPMNGIIGLTRLTQDIPNLSSEVQDNLVAIDDSSQYLLKFINDVLDMNKIESQKIILNPEIVESNIFIHNVIKSILTLTKAKNIHVEYIPIHVKNEYVKVDKMRLQQVFVNILSNAVKFTPENGTIRIEVECIKCEQNTADIRVRISDTGVGMNEEFMPHLFEPFAQEQANAKLNYAGTGLGMSIVKSLVELMGGKVAVESKVGEGTCVTVRLKLDYVENGKQEDKEEHRWQGDALKNKRALLVEDHPLNAEIAQKLLENQGMIVEHAENGELGVERFVASELSYYDVVLMDIRMPVMDGLEAEKAIRALDRADAKIIPIIAMTANAFDEDVKKSLASGMNAHLAKPINPEELYATIAKYS